MASQNTTRAVGMHPCTTVLPYATGTFSQGHKQHTAWLYPLALTPATVSTEVIANITIPISRRTDITIPITRRKDITITF